MEAKNNPNRRAAQKGFRCIAAPMGWHRNTDLCVDLKTLLRSDTCARTGKTYQGLLRRDSDAEIEEYRARDPHYTFIETVAAPSRKRNPYLFRGKLINVTRRDDGSLRLSFRQLNTGPGFSVPDFAVGVANELLQALEGLVER